MVRRGYEEVLDVVALFEVHPHDPDASPVLRAIGRDRQAFHVARVGDGDDHLLHRDHVFDVDLVFRRKDLRATVVTVHLLDLEQFLLDHLVDAGFARQYVLQVRDALQQVAVLFLDLVALECGEVAQPQIDDSLSLLVGEPEACGEAHFGGVCVLAGADDADDLVEVADGDQQTFQDVGPLLGFVKLEARPADDDFLLVRDVVTQHVAQAEGLGHPVREGQHVDPERGLHGRVLEQLVEHYLGDRFALQLDDHPHARTIGFVAQVGDLRDLLLPHQFGDLLDELGLVHLVGELGDDDGGLALLDGLGMRPGPHHDPAAARLVGLPDASMPHDQATGGESRGLSCSA